MPEEIQDGVTEAVSDEQAQELLADAVDSMLDENADAPKTYDEKYVKRLRDEAASRRIREKEKDDRIAELANKLKSFEDSQLSDAERAQNELNELRESSTTYKTRAQNLEIDFQLALAATDPQNGIGDVKAAIKLIDRENLEFDSKGRITNLASALDALKAEYPSVGLVNKAVAPNTGTTNPGKATTSVKYTRADLKNMSPQRIVELQESGELNHLLGPR